MVCGSSGQVEEKDHTGANNDDINQKTEDVQLPRMERLENCIQEVLFCIISEICRHLAMFVVDMLACTFVVQ